MLPAAFIVPLLSHFAITLPASFCHIVPFLYTKYQYRNDDSIVIHQNRSCKSGTVIFVHGRNGHSSVL
uniref:Uncharacterized protein n=1 Tax=viral metagenome TaxID=1070528 RepID=A0A6C0C9I2_9ZZZZ